MADGAPPRSSSSVEDVESVSQQVSNDPDSPTELFKKMVIDNGEQNKRLSQKFASKSPNSRVNFKFKYTVNKSGVDLGASTEEKSLKPKLRFVICSLAIASLAMCQMSRMVLNLSITSMVDPSVLSTGLNISDDGSCPWPDGEENQNILKNNELVQEQTTTTFDGILYYLTSDYQNLADTPSSETNIDTRNIDTRGRLSEIYGAKYVLLLTVAGSSIINLATPWLARYSFTSLVASRIILGMIQAGVVPGSYALFSKWLTLSETGIYTSLMRVFFCIGSILGSSIFGLFTDWEDVFYCAGLIGLTWSILWICIATSSPQDNRWISEAELQHIRKKKRKFTCTKKTCDVEMEEKVPSGDASKHSQDVESHTRVTATPWLEILTNPSVIGFVMAKLSYNYLMDFMFIELPSYLKFVHHASNHTISLIHTAINLTQAVLAVFVGWLAQSLIRKRALNLSKTVWRKIFEGLSTYASGVAIILLTFNNCNLVYVAIVLEFIALLSMFNVGGDVILPYDLSDEYPATIAAIGNSIANLSGITTTVIAGQILGDQGGSSHRWNLFIRLVGGINILGGFAFTVLVSAKPIVFKENSTDQVKDSNVPAVEIWISSANSKPIEDTSQSCERVEKG